MVDMALEREIYYSDGIVLSWAEPCQHFGCKGDIVVDGFGGICWLISWLGSKWKH